MRPITLCKIRRTDICREEKRNTKDVAVPVDYTQKKESELYLVKKNTDKIFEYEGNKPDQLP